MKKSELRNIIRNIISEQNTTGCKAITAKSCDEFGSNYYLPCALMGPSVDEWIASGEALWNLPGSTPQVGDTFFLLPMLGGPKDYKVIEVSSPTSTIVQVVPAAENPEACSESPNTDDSDTDLNTDDSGIDDSDTDNSDDFSGGPGGGPSGGPANQKDPVGTTPFLTTNPNIPSAPKKTKQPFKGDMQKDRMKKLANIKPRRKR